MALSKDLLEILVCPLCKAPLEVKPDESGSEMHAMQAGLPGS